MINGCRISFYTGDNFFLPNQISKNIFFKKIVKNKNILQQKT
jgi:hypothetical protein